ncbi:gp36 putative tail-fiber protein [Iodobacter phage PhiPLPE]|uniref:Gp36 putative tail-fiber protein n=1 Tax=Iodobacter phage PhiPLPE TaxID=551895 RepID=B5AX55_9CAUD|nr:gp36 putative tail-fiber protein [Iodobacter phage PhiPLPE]ACG60358.1 gp36 putative tail-fiber protein [Iodobacter phage PhiPLPE]
MSNGITLVRVCPTRAALKNQPQQMMTTSLFFFTREDGFAICDDKNIILIDSMVTAPTISQNAQYPADFTINGYLFTNIDTKLEALGYKSHLQLVIERTKKDMVKDPATGAVTFVSTPGVYNFVEYLNEFCVTPDQFTRYAASMGADIETTSVDDFVESDQGKIAESLWQKQDTAISNGESYKEWLNEKYFGADCLAPAESPKAIKNIEFMALKAEAIQIGMVVEWHGAKYGLPVPAGYVLCDGSTINDPASPLNGKVTVDKRGRVSAMADSSNAFGSTKGVESFFLDQASLPRVTLGGYGNYTPSGSVTVDTVYPTGNNPVPVSTSGWQTYDYATIAGTGNFFPKVSPSNTITNGNTTHNHPASFSGNNVNISVNTTLNPASNQAALSNMQPTVYVNYIMRIK